MHADKTKQVKILVQINKFESETLNCIIALCADYNIALDINWLKKYNSEISFRHKTITKRI